MLLKIVASKPQRQEAVYALKFSYTCLTLRLACVEGADSDRVLRLSAQGHSATVRTDSYCVVTAYVSWSSERACFNGALVDLSLLSQ